MWVFEGDIGKVLEGWFVKLLSEVLVVVLVIKFVFGESSVVDIVSIKYIKKIYS